MLLALVIPFHVSLRGIDVQMFNLVPAFSILRLTYIYFFTLQRLKDEIAEVTSEIENLGSTEER